MHSNYGVLGVARSAFTAEHLTSRPVFAVDPWAPARAARDELEKHSFDIAPVDDGGSYYRYVQRDWLVRPGQVGDLAKPIEAAQMVPSNALLVDCLSRLADRSWLFVISEEEEVSGIIALADLQKPSLSLFAFAIILAIEAYLKTLIAKVDDWMTYLTPDRLAKLEAIHDTRRRYNVDTALIDAATIDDQMSLSAKLKLYGGLGFGTGKSFDRWATWIKRLRDVLAHGGTVLDQNPDPRKALAQVLEL